MYLCVCTVHILCCSTVASVITMYWYINSALSMFKVKERNLKENKPKNVILLAKLRCSFSIYWCFPSSMVF